MNVSKGNKEVLGLFMVSRGGVEVTSLEKVSPPYSQDVPSAYQSLVAFAQITRSAFFILFLILFTRFWV